MARKKGNGKPRPTPILPNPRPRALSATRPSPLAIADSNCFFRRIPPEIRRCILLYAFGEQTVHLELSLKYPLEKRVIYPSTHANSNNRRPRDGSKSVGWQWRGSVCHRTKLHWSVSPRFYCGCHDAAPWRDVCHSVDTDTVVRCWRWPGAVPGKCFVGVMGFLLSCRQAYLEVIDLLYSTNQFHINGTHLLRKLPQLLVPARLAAIRSAELQWFVKPWPSEHRYPRDYYKTGLDTDWFKILELPHESGTDHFRALLDTLPRALPNLQFLCLSLDGDVYPRYYYFDWVINRWGDKDVLERIEQLLVLIDGMVRKMASLTDCRVAFPGETYTKMKSLQGENARPCQDDDCHSDFMWRELVTEDGDAKLTTVPHITGYWICPGMFDSRYRRR